MAVWQSVFTGSFVSEKRDARTRGKAVNKKKEALCRTVGGVFSIDTLARTDTHSSEKEREAGTNEAVYIGILFHSRGLLGERGLPITL